MFDCECRVQADLSSEAMEFHSCASGNAGHIFVGGGLLLTYGDDTVVLLIVFVLDRIGQANAGEVGIGPA